MGEIHRINPEILGYPRIPGYPLTASLHIFSMINGISQQNIIGQQTTTYIVGTDGIQRELASLTRANTYFLNQIFLSDKEINV